ncbi:zinc finger protein 99-like [Anopheles cruzii]|uniref:zinc finger protein 99-like n=1 Tax=Anopheles cruzii TaxID=68878 RepID=UPI0022EC3728|nr:zinc finger protein 99-like [Anopheles cruzii]
MPQLAKKRNTNTKPAKSCRTKKPLRRSRRIVRHSATTAPSVKSLIFTEPEPTDGFDKRPYSCNVCEKRFSNKKSVKTHMVTIHEGGKPFVCEECGTRWSTKKSLKQHQIVHIDKYPYHYSRRYA